MTGEDVTRRLEQGRLYIGRVAWWDGNVTVARRLKRGRFYVGRVRWGERSVLQDEVIA